MKNLKEIIRYLRLPHYEKKRYLVSILKERKKLQKELIKNQIKIKQIEIDILKAKLLIYNQK